MCPQQKYILRWVEENRPDLLDHFKTVMQNEAIWMLMSVAFEGGRLFQYLHPKKPLGPGAYYDLL